MTSSITSSLSKTTSTTRTRCRSYPSLVGVRFLGLLGLMTFSGCATSSRVMVGAQRDAMGPESVVLYLSPPNIYEEIAMITADSDGSWTFTQQGKMEEVIRRLKQEAGAVGANGVLIRGVSQRNNDPVLLGDGEHIWDVGIAISEHEKTAWAIAIYVPMTETESLFSLLSRRSPLGCDSVASNH